MKSFKYIVCIILMFVTSDSIARLVGNSRDRAGLAFVEGRYEDAIALLQTWLKNQPKDWASIVNLAKLQELTNRKQEAEQNYQKALNLANHYAAAYEYARFLYENKQYAKAIPYAKKALVDPKGNANVLLAKIYHSLGKENDYRDELLNALKKNPKNEEAINLLIPLLLEKKDFRSADRILSNALSKFPLSTALYWNGKTLMEQERPTAKKYFDQYLKMYPNGIYAEQCIAELKKLLPAVDYNEIRNNIVKKFTNIPQNPMGDRVLVAGKKWHYKVSWNFVNLGRLTIEPLERTTLYGRPVWKLKYSIVSNPAIPIVDINDYYESYVDVDFRYTSQFFAITKTNGRYDYSLYEMDINEGRMKVKTFSREGILRIEEKDLAMNAFDGTSVLTWARQMIANNNFGKAVTVVDGEYEYSYILPNFEETKLISLGTERPVKKFNAQVGYIGIAGLTGKAIGWITSDWENLPLKANFQIKVGSIDVELEKVE